MQRSGGIEPSSLGFRRAGADPSAGAWRRAPESNRPFAVLQTAPHASAARHHRSDSGPVQLARIELARPRWQRGMRPQHLSCLLLVRVDGFEPSRPAWKAGVLAVEHQTRVELAAGVEPAESVIPRRAPSDGNQHWWRCSVTLRVALLARQSSSLLRPSPLRAASESNAVLRTWKPVADHRPRPIAPRRGFDPLSTRLDKPPSTPADPRGKLQIFACPACARRPVTRLRGHAPEALEGPCVRGGARSHNLSFRKRALVQSSCANTLVGVRVSIPPWTLSQSAEFTCSLTPT